MSPPDQTFINPYQFIPVDEKPAANKADALRCKLPSMADFKGRRNLGRLRHDTWHSDDEQIYSGRLVCKLTTVTPLVIGAEQTKTSPDAPTTITPYKIDGRPAIPATSLRGMLSSFCERVSASALRVLHDQKPLSYRMEMNNALSAMGVLRMRDGQLVLQPLSVPHIRAAGNKFELDRKWSKVFRHWRLKIYFGNCTSSSISLTKQINNNDEIAGNINGIEHKRNFYYIPAQENLGSISSPLFRDDARLHKKAGQAPVILLAQAPSADPAAQLPASMVRGLVRELGWRDDFPTTKKHEIFLPYPVEAEQFHEAWPTFPIATQALARFRQLADQSYDKDENDPAAQRPYGELHRARTASGQMSGPLEPKEWDIVFFDVEEVANDRIEVSEISYSSIWRRRIETRQKDAVGVFDFFKSSESTAGRELLPMHSGRKTLTPAEALFGFVGAEHGQGLPSGSAVAGDGGGKGLAYAGRVRVSAGMLADEDTTESFMPNMILLKAQGSPKLPSPAMYFYKDEPRSAIARTELSPEKHLPNGAKMYVNRKEPDRWKSRGEPQKDRFKSLVTPVRPGATFWFHIDFDNLSEMELALLAYTVSPSADFQHKLGFGKGLGLGSVRAAGIVLALCDRGTRYRSAEARARRWHKVISVEARPIARYADIFRAKQVQASENASRHSKLAQTAKFAQGLPSTIDGLAKMWADEFASTLPRTHAAIVRMGQPHSNVSPPLAEGQINDEDETFKWHVNNQNPKTRCRQALGPLHLDLDDPMPTLNSNREPPGNS
jgi:CRISPR-associated protein (TIGR03986 family)